VWFADASEFGLYPHLARCRMRRGRQAQVKSPGKNKKVSVFGARCYGKGLFTHHTRPRTTAAGMRRIVRRLVNRARQTGKRVVLVLDRGNPNHARSLHRDPEAAKEWVDVFWLPHYCRNLNLIERLWRHIKDSRMANALSPSFRQFARHVEDALDDFAKHPDLTLTIVARKRRDDIRK
jgi:transposase